MNLSLLYPSHANDLHIKTACVPPRTFRHASNCSGIDHQVSGRNPLTPRTISTPTQVNYGHVAFAMASIALNLANGLHSLARSSKRKLQHRRYCSYCCLATGSFAVRILACCNTRSPVSFRHFSFPFQGYFSVFAHATISLSVLRSI